MYGTAALKSECESAVSWVAAQNQATPARSLQVGYNGTCGDPGWGSVPLGCSVAQLHGDWTAHWKESGVNCNNHYQLMCSGAPASCEDLGHTTSGVYTIYTIGGPRQVKCKYADGRMWTLVYKIAGHSIMKTDEAQNVTALTESITTSHSGKLSQAEIKELCSEQFWLTQSETSANVYCAFDNISDYADGSSTPKKCSQTFSPLWAKDVFTAPSGNTSSDVATDYAPVGTGLCDPSLGIRVYEGNGDNNGTTQERKDRCALACLNKNTPLAYGPWSRRGDALGFGVAESNGTCYCQHQAYASCTKDHHAYTTYEFIGIPSSSIQGTEGFSSGTIITQLAYTTAWTHNLPGYSCLVCCTPAGVRLVASLVCDPYATISRHV